MVFSAQVIFTVISPSEAVPDEWENVIQLSVEDTLQFRLHVKLKDCEPPSRVKLNERGPVIVRIGACWQDATDIIKAATRTRKRRKCFMVRAISFTNITKKYTHVAVTVSKLR